MSSILQVIIAIVVSAAAMRCSKAICSTDDSSYKAELSYFEAKKKKRGQKKKGSSREKGVKYSLDTTKDSRDNFRSINYKQYGKKNK